MSKKSPKISKKILEVLADKPAYPVLSLQNELLEAFLDEFGSIQTKPKYAISRAFKNLAESGLIETLQSDNDLYVRLTREGRQKKHSLYLDNEQTIVPVSWDGFWRIVMLDVPENRKSEREALRYLLKKAGFVCVKNSVWVSPYPYEHLFTNIKKDLGLKNELMIIVSDRLDPETEKDFMNLKK